MKWIAALTMLSPRAAAPTLRAMAVLGLALLSHGVRAQQVQVVLAPAGSGSCPEERAKITTLIGCMMAMRDLGLSGWKGPKFTPAWPEACYYCDEIYPQCEGVWLNIAPGSANDRAAPICAAPDWEDNIVSKYRTPRTLCQGRPPSLPLPQAQGGVGCPFSSTSLTFFFCVDILSDGRDVHCGVPRPDRRPDDALARGYGRMG